MLIRVWVLLDVETTRKMDILSRKKTWATWPLKRNQEITKSTYFIQMSLTQCLPKMTSWLGNHLNSTYDGKLKHQDKERCCRDSTFSSSRGQRALPHQERLFYLAPPSCSLHFALLLLMFRMTLKPDPKRPAEIQGGKKCERERDWDRRQEKGVFKKQEIEVHQNSRRCSQYSYHLIASPLALSFLLCILPLSCFGFRPGQSGLIS